MAQSTLLVMATGLGKTVVMAKAAATLTPRRVLLIAHRQELINQAKEKLEAVCNEACGVEQAESAVDESHEWKPRIVVASVPTLNSRMKNGRYRMEKFDPYEFGLIMTDEAHHATSKTYRTIYDWFLRNKNCKHLGVTATPDRADEEALGQVFESVAFEYGISEGIKDGWLVDIEQQFVHVEGLDLSQCNADKHDLKNADVAKVMEQEGLLHKIVDPVIQLAEERPTLVFAASVEHAHRMAEIFNRHRPGSAAAIDGKTPDDVREDTIKRFKAGSFQYLCNMGVFLEGFDAPNIACVAVARPTKSRALYAQVIGRGTRPLPGVVDRWEEPDQRREAIACSSKSHLLVLDFVGNSGRHKLVSTADVLGGNESDMVIDRASTEAKAKGARGESVNMQEELTKARAALEEEERLKEVERQKRQHVIAKAKFSTKAINPFNVFDLVPKREPGWFKGKMPSERMKQALRNFKVDDQTIAKATQWEAQQMLDKLVERRKKGLCTIKQAKLLAKHGYSTEVSFTEAGSIIDRLAKNNWKPLT